MSECVCVYVCACTLQIARKQARETKQASEIEREGKVCVCVSEQPETDSVLPALAQLMKNE